MSTAADSRYPTLTQFWKQLQGEGDHDDAGLYALFGAARSPLEPGRSRSAQPILSSASAESSACARVTGGDARLWRLLAGTLLASAVNVWADIDGCRVGVCACAEAVRGRSALVPIDVDRRAGIPVGRELVRAGEQFRARSARRRGLAAHDDHASVVVLCGRCGSRDYSALVRIQVDVAPGKPVVVSACVWTDAPSPLATRLASLLAAAMNLAARDSGREIERILAAAGRASSLPTSVIHGDSTPESEDILQLWRRQVDLRGNAVCIVRCDDSTTYRRLDELSDRAAAALDQAGIPAEQPVGITDDRSTEAIVAVLAAIKARRVWVPIPPELPCARRTAMLAAAGAKAVLGPGSELTIALTVAPGHAGGYNCSRTPIPPSTELCILFTSGSTGVPAAVRLTHGAALNRLAWMWNRYPWSAGESGIWLKSLGLVGSLWEVFGALLAGRPTIIASAADVMDPARLWGLLERHRVTRLLTSPPVLRLLLDHAVRSGDCAGAHLRLVSSSAEPLTTAVAQAWRAQFPGHKLINLYGLTEGTSNVAVFEVDNTPDTAQVPIGVPIDNCSMYILDRAGHVLPRGAMGELFIAGRCVAAGLVDRGDHGQFKADPVRGGTMVKTGDLGRMAADGQVALLGRRDNQVKLRGFRIALEEVEAVVRRAPGVGDAACALVGEAEEAALVCWWTRSGRADGQQTGPENLAEHAQRVLPAAMVPARFIRIETIPRLPGHKVDRRTLRGLDAGAPLTGVNRRLPRRLPEHADPASRTIHDIETLLGHPVDPGDRLASLDLHSLRMVQLYERLARWSPAAFEVIDLFRCGTVADICRLTAQELVPAPGRVSERARNQREALSRFGLRREGGRRI